MSGCSAHDDSVRPPFLTIGASDHGLRRVPFASCGIPERRVASACRFDRAGEQLRCLAGRAGVRFDVRFRDDLDCSVNEPCVYAVWTRFGLTKQWRSGFEHRVWWIEEYPGGPLMISASTTEADFLAEADELVESISFSDS